VIAKDPKYAKAYQKEFKVKLRTGQ